MVRADSQYVGDDQKWIVHCRVCHHVFEPDPVYVASHTLPDAGMIEHMRMASVYTTCPSCQQPIDYQTNVQLTEEKQTFGWVTE